MALQVWAPAHPSLREISRADVLEVLPSGGSARVNCLQGLRSIFRVLKARKLVFTDPTARLRSGMPQQRTPLPLDLTALRAAVDAEDPVRAALAALLAYHALRAAQLRGLRLVDVLDGRLQVDGRVILLAPAARARLAAYLDWRQRRWPNSANPHLFINRVTAVTANPVSGFWVAATLGTSAQAIREDRILDEAHATSGDIRRLCDLFGLSVGAAIRYTSTLDPPGLSAPITDGHHD